MTKSLEKDKSRVTQLKTHNRKTEETIMKTYIQKITQHQNLTKDEAKDAIHKIFTQATDAQIAAFLTALKMKGEAVEEIAGLAEGMRAAANTIHPKISGTLVDTCGTGGDSQNTINISTAAAIITSAAGIPVAKHGNYSITSKSGSADLLKALGVTIDLPPEKVQQTIEKTGIGFMLAPVFHPSMKRVAGVRKEIGLRTVFNILGPLTNPAGAKTQLIGCFDPALCETLASALKLLGTTRAMLVHGEGLDEITTTGTTNITELNKGEITNYTLTPEELGIPRANIKDLQGGTPEENAKGIIKILLGEKGAKHDIITLNAAAAIVIGGEAKDFAEGLEVAEKTLERGRALEKLKEFVKEAGDLSVLEELLDDTG
jgi:anthranilate phosphoribosyltransferase